MQLKQEELKTAIILWPNQGSGVASYGALLHVWLDLGADPNKSTGVDLRTSSRVGLVLPGAVDSKSNLELKSDFTASRLEIEYLELTFT